MTRSADAVPSRLANDGRVRLEGVPDIRPEIVDRVARYQNGRAAAVGDWTLDSALHVLTRFAAVAQLHRVERPGGARRQITFYPEPVLDVVRRPGTEELLLTMDEGGSEFWQLFLFDPLTGERRRLTDGESRNADPCWSLDGRRLAFTSTRRTGTANDVWVLNPDDPDGAECVLEGEGGANWGGADWSADGRRLLVHEYVSIGESRIHLLDLESGERRILAGGDRRASWLGVTPRLLAGDAGVLVATDAGSEFRRLGRLDRESGRFEAWTEDIPWDVETLALSEDRGRGAFVVNRDGYSDLFLFDPESGEHSRVQGVPDGIVLGIRFSPAGDALALTLAAVDEPADAFSLPLGDDPLAHGRLQRWTFSETGGLRRDRIATPELIRYPSFDGREIPAFLYRPPGAGPHPVVVQIHGGPESQTRPEFVPSYQMWIDELGAAVLRPNVRGSAGYGKTYLSLDDGRLREDSVRDIGALLHWVEAHPELDEGRVAVYGGSYGGYMVLASLVHYADRLAAGVELVGISNFVTFLENTQGYRRELRRVEYGDERDPEMREFLESISPSTHAQEIRTPLLVAQGANDPRVPESESRQIVDAVRANGRPVWYMNALNEGHGFRRRENQDLFVQLVLLFLERHLVGEEAKG